MIYDRDSNDPQAGRCYIISISPAALFNMLGGWRQRGQIALPVLTECINLDGGEPITLPDDFRIDGVKEDAWDRCFQIRISHPTFPEVPEGMPIPRVGLKSYLMKILKEVRDNVFEETDESPAIVDAPKARDPFPLLRG